MYGILGWGKEEREVNRSGRWESSGEEEEKIKSGEAEVSNEYRYRDLNEKSWGEADYKINWT